MNNTNIVLTVKNSKNGDTMDYELSTKIFDLTNNKLTKALLSNLNKKYGKNFDMVYYSKN